MYIHAAVATEALRMLKAVLFEIHFEIKLLES